MKTVLIFDQLFQRPITFRTVEGDFSHLHQKYVNSTNLSIKDFDELMGLLYKNDDGDVHDDWTEEFPVSDVDKSTKVVVVGFLP